MRANTSADPLLELTWMCLFCWYHEKLDWFLSNSVGYLNILNYIADGVSANSDSLSMSKDNKISLPAALTLQHFLLGDMNVGYSLHRDTSISVIGVSPQFS